MKKGYIIVGIEESEDNPVFIQMDKCRVYPTREMAISRLKEITDYINSTEPNAIIRMEGDSSRAWITFESGSEEDYYIYEVSIIL